MVIAKSRFGKAFSGYDHHRGGPLAGIKMAKTSRRKTAMDKLTRTLITRIAGSLPRNMPNAIIQRWIDDPRSLQDFLQRLAPPESGFPRFIGSVVVKGGQRLVVRDLLEKDYIGWADKSFERSFLNTVEVDVHSAELNIHQFENGLCDRRIFEKLGGEEGAVIYLTHFLHSLRICPRGSYSAYVRDHRRKIQIVSARWINADYDVIGRYHVTACSFRPIKKRGVDHKVLSYSSTSKIWGT